MGFGGGNMNKMMKQVQQMQAKMAKLQEELEQKTVEATVGGGVVRVVANGKNEILEVEIKPEILDPEEVEMLQDLVIAACNEALRKAQDMVAEEIGKITGGLKLPVMPGMF